MKKWNRILITSLIAMMLTAQPVWADANVQLIGPGMENTAAQVYTGSPVVVAGSSEVAEVSGAAAVTVQQNGAAETGNQTQTAETASSRVIVAGQAQVDSQVTGPGTGVAGQQASEAAQQEASAEEASAEEAAAAEEAAQQEPVGRQIDPSKPMVALTYDDGPQPSVGNRIMDCLAQYGGKATFFLVGERVPGFAAEVQRMAAEGHEIANHTQNHLYLHKTDAAGVQAQVAQCNAAIQAASGVAPTLMRLPGGIHNETVRANVGMPMIQWNIDTLDWKHRNADTTVNTILSQVKDGDIILMHELYSQTADATDCIVPELVNRGFQLVTVSEMAAAKGVALQAGQVYSVFQ